MSVSAFAAEVPENSEEQTEQEVLQLVSMTSDTIVLKVEDGYEYGIQIEENDETVWSWAREEQYSDGEDGKVVTFSELAPETEYWFARRLTGTDQVDTQDIQSFTTIAQTPGARLRGRRAQAATPRALRRGTPLSAHGTTRE